MPEVLSKDDSMTLQITEMVSQEEEWVLEGKMLKRTLMALEEPV